MILNITIWVYLPQKCYIQLIMFCSVFPGTLDTEMTGLPGRPRLIPPAGFTPAPARGRGRPRGSRGRASGRGRGRGRGQVATTSTTAAAPSQVTTSLAPFDEAEFNRRVDARVDERVSAHLAAIGLT